jgi:hypothetical protein
LTGQLLRRTPEDWRCNHQAGSLTADSGRFSDAVLSRNAAVLIWSLALQNRIVAVSTCIVAVSTRIVTVSIRIVSP